MQMEVEPEIFKWLQSLNLAKEGRRTQNNLIEIGQEPTTKLMDGFSMGILIKSLLKGKGEDQKLKKLQAIKENSTPAIRLYNWNILAQLLKQLKYSLELADKSKITSYDFSPIPPILKHLYDLKMKDPNLKLESQGLKVDMGEIGKKGLKQASNALQFLTISISKNFKLSPQQTLNLFLDNNKYLSHLMVKGVKNSYEPIFSLLGEIKANVDFIVQNLFCIDEQLNVNFFLTAIKSCFISKDPELALICSCIFLDLYDSYRLNLMNLQPIRNWIKNQGINTLFFSFKKHHNVMSNIISICYNFLDDQFFGYCQLAEKSILWNSQRQKYEFYKNFVVQASKEILLKFSLTNYFQDWNKFFIKAMKKVKENQEILLVSVIMEQQWGKLGAKFQQNELGLPNIYINFLKTINSSLNQLLFIQSTRTLFSLMQSLGEVKNPYAPLIYKLLISSFSSCTVNSHVVYMAENFSLSFKQIPGLPGDPLISSLLRQLQNSLEYPLLELSKILLEEKRISQTERMQLIEMLTKIIFHDISYGGVVIEFLFDILDNFDEGYVINYLENHTKLCLAHLYSTCKNITKNIKNLEEQAKKLPTNEHHKTVQNCLSMLSKHIICRNLVNFISKTIFFNETMKLQMESSIFHTYIKIKVELKKIEQAELLRKVMISYYPDEDELEDKIAYYHNLLYPPKPKLPPQEKQKQPKSYNHQHLSKSVTFMQQRQKQPIILDPTNLKPSNFAIKDLQKVKQKRYEMKTLELEKQKQKQKRQEKIQKFRTIMYEKRMLQSMNTIKNDVQYKSVLHYQEKNKEDQTLFNTQNNGVVTIKLLNLEKQEEFSYIEEAEAILKRYRKVWRYLFYKYSGNKIQDVKVEEKAHIGQVWKMMKQYDFNILKKQECFTIIRLINQNLKRKKDIQCLNYPGFEQYILQAAVFAYSRAGYPHLPPGQHLLMFIQQLKKITKQKAGSVQIFQNPEQTYFQQTEVIHQFNKRLRANSEYILPEGYKKVKQTNLQYEYSIHPFQQKNIKSSYVDVLEILDSIFKSRPQLGFPIIEPITLRTQRYLAKPVLFQNISEKMKDYSKGYLQPKKRLNSASSRQKIVQKSLSPSPLPAKRQFKPFRQFTLGIKLGIAEVNMRNKSIAEEVAYCMDDILDAIDNQSDKVKNKAKKKITNDYMRRKRIQLVKIENEKKSEQFNWKKRAESVKLEVQALRQKRRETEKAKKKNEYISRKMKKEKEQKMFREKMQQFERVKSKIAEKKEALLEMKAIEDEKLKKEKEQYKLGVQQYFKKKKEQIKQKQEEYKRKKAEQKEKQEDLQQNKKQFAKKLYLSNLKKEEDVVEKVEEIKQTYNDVWRSDEIQDTMVQNRRSLKYLFDLLLKYEKSKISATNYDQIGLNTLNYFCLKFKIIPFMLQKNDLAKIFVYATKQIGSDRKSLKKGISCEKFQEAIFLIAVKAKKILNKIIEKKKKKEKKMQAFINAQKNGNGNHFEAPQIEELQSQEQDEEQEKMTLQDEYLFNAEDVGEETVQAVFNFLKLPKDKQGVEERYRQAMESKNSKPKNVLIKELKASLEE